MLHFISAGDWFRRRSPRFWRIQIWVIQFGLAAGLALSRASAKTNPESIVALDGVHARFVRDLTPAESAARSRFSIALRLRNFAELEQRIQTGEQISRAELEANYLPLRADYERVRSWLVNRGFTVTLDDIFHTQIFAEGSVAQSAGAFHVVFARVSSRGEEYSSAVTAPELPDSFADRVLGVIGLQPHVRARASSAFPSGNAPLTNIAKLTSAVYNLPSNLSGAGQTVAIVGESQVLDSDLAQFWSTYGVNRIGALTRIAVAGGGTGTSAEDTLDVSMVSAVAPAANIRLYEGPAALSCFVSVLNDLPSTPTMSVLSSSYGFDHESDTSSANMSSLSQTLALVAASGVTVLVSSGDGGTNPVRPVSSAHYDPTSSVAVGYPASDPNVTSVGGSVIDKFGAETGWGGKPAKSGVSYGGGGFSTVFAQPYWQATSPWGAGSGNGMRMVPDWAASAQNGSFVVNGTTKTAGGTSESAPLTAGMVALINQARAAAGYRPVGLLGPLIYPLLGTSCFNDVADGNSNGLYATGPGYDLVTGVGTPNVGNLILALTSAVTVVNGATNSVVRSAAPGQSVSLQVTASGAGPLSYQWQWQPAGSSNWLNLSDGSGVAGSATVNLIVTASSALNGGRFQCVVRNAFASDSSEPVTLTVEVAGTVTTLAGAPGVQSPISGPLASARLSYSYGIALDPAGSIYVSDYGWKIVSKISGGTIQTLAGSQGNGGTADGQGTSARFGNPWGIAVDSSGNVIVADYTNHTIRKVTPAGSVSTLAGTAGVPGSVDGLGTGAAFNHPRGLRIDAAGNVYVCDQGNSTIRKITPGGVVTTFAGSPGHSGSADGPVASALFSIPYDLTIDSDGTIYVCDSNVIRKISPVGLVSTLAGSTSGASDGLGGQAQFSLPHGIAVDAAGNLFVADTGNNSIRMVTPFGAVSTLAGSSTPGSSDGSGTFAAFNTPSAVAVDSSELLHIADSNNFTVRTIALVAPAAVSGLGSPQTVPAGHSITLSVTASGKGPLSYQWYFQPVGGGVKSALAGASGSTLTLANVQPANAGTYLAAVTNPSGLVSTAMATIAVSSPGAPAILAQPKPVSLAAGATTVFAVGAPGGTAWQWYFNGKPIAGATKSTYVVPGGASTASAGQYFCQVANSQGSSLTQTVTLALASPAADPGRLVNLSVNAIAGVDNPLTIGFFNGGAGTSGNQSLLFRAMGPSLSQFGLTGFLLDPTLTLYNQSGVSIGSNDNWGANLAAVTAADTATGAFTPAGALSLDAALVTPLPAGGYTIVLSGNGSATGQLVAECYDAVTTRTATIPRLINLSCRTALAAGTAITAGFVIGGSTARTVLARATGPALAAFGLTGTMTDPQLKLYDASGNLILVNAGWGGDAQITTVGNALGVFPLTDAASADSVVLVTLPPGLYSVQASSLSGNGGVVLVEVYEAP